ncbi:5'-nucleotidase C-terminal domain-containing protein [Chitinophaga polysaccharea]|uniref:5'-nucleotidase C-terminal domain-containing protein n=1 Tax=Chitinophaga polysaccharea TaxID=1293035 RepID=UPI00163C1AFB|nr:5'-nucleotidase C-terminal domain-containing protein [Chitinophaga polysaccharea]
MKSLLNPTTAISSGVPDESGRKAITKEDLWRLLPVNEHMKVGEVTGRQVKDWLEKEINNAFSKNPGERFGGWLVRFSVMYPSFSSRFIRS